MRHLEVIYCDDVRQEVGNKQSLIGVYPGDLYLEALPAVLPKLCMVATLVIPAAECYESLRIKAMQGEHCLFESGDIPPPGDEVIEGAQAGDNEWDNAWFPVVGNRRENRWPTSIFAYKSIATPCAKRGCGRSKFGCRIPGDRNSPWNGVANPGSSRKPTWLTATCSALSMMPWPIWKVGRPDARRSDHDRHSGRFRQTLAGSGDPGRPVPGLEPRDLS